MDIRIRPMIEADAGRVLSVYAEGIEDGQATFETACPDWAGWDAHHLREGRMVAESEGTVIGWAALSPVSSRSCYRGVAEVSIYMARSARGQGVGKLLLAALIEAAEQYGFWTLQGGTFEDNKASLAIQRAFDFRVVGRRERIAQRDGVWKSTILTERRSRKNGV
ncbi:MAG: GNAT family N-acetyltransferase [Acidobacteriota bacterium]|nr:GNAT family N-acetyltransferase [Acidobacteriota bacterium]